ncbi:MAG: hypothetical protein ACYCZC_07330 [Acidithiobacillus sp.]
MKRPQIGPLLVAVLLVLWAGALVALVIIAITHIQPRGIGSAHAKAVAGVRTAVPSAPSAPAGATHE